MKSKLDLKSAVRKIFGNSLREVVAPAGYWQMFNAFTTGTGEEGSTVLLKLIEIPANYKTSEEIIEKTKQQFKNILHNVDFILVERNFYHDLYLLKATQNLISVESLIQIKRQAGEKIDEQVIEKFLQFASMLEAHQYSERISFGIDEIGVTENGNFLLANYHMYFNNEQEKREKTLSKDVKYAVLRLLMPDSKTINLSELYSHVEENYDPNIRSMVQMCMTDGEFKASQVLTTNVTQGEHNLMETTITDSFHSDPIMPEQVANISSITGDLSQNLLPANPKQSPQKSKYRATIFAILFLLILIVIGAITFTYLKPRPFTCQPSQYLDTEQNKCFGCDSSCGTCIGKAKDSCLSCQGDLFLVKKDKTVKSGKCSQSCSGKMVKSNVCIDNE